MKELIKLFNQFWTARSRDIIIGCVGKIESFDRQLMRADVQPLIEYTPSRESKSISFAVIGDCPVQFLHAGGYYIRPEYQRGDLVWVSYATFSIERGMSKGFDDYDGSIFSRENACVVNGLAPENWSAPAAFNNSGLLIGHQNGNVTVNLTESDIIGKGTKFTWNGSFEILNATEPAVMGNTLVSIMNTFCTALSGITPGTVAQNAAALGIIKTAASTLQAQLDTIKASKVKIS